jgi:hypothetical protein
MASKRKLVTELWHSYSREATADASEEELIARELAFFEGASSMLMVFKMSGDQVEAARQELEDWRAKLRPARVARVALLRGQHGGRN